jgi:hypothetical protein
VLVFAALGIQIGISNIAFLPLWLAVAHNAGAAFLLTSLLMLNFRLSDRPPSRLPHLVSCPTDSRPKTRREWAPCCERLAQRTFRYPIVYLSLPFVALLADHYWRVPI